MASAVWELDVALYDHLRLDAGVRALLGTVEEGTGDQEARILSVLAPEGTPLPYVVIGEPTEGPAHVFGRRGTENTVTLHIWVSLTGEELSRREAAAIYSALHAALDGRWIPMTLPGAEFVNVRGSLELVTGLVDQNGEAYHMVARYRAINRRAA